MGQWNQETHRHRFCPAPAPVHNHSTVPCRYHSLVLNTAFSDPVLFCPAVCDSTCQCTWGGSIPPHPTHPNPLQMAAYYSVTLHKTHPIPPDGFYDALGTTSLCYVPSQHFIALSYNSSAELYSTLYKGILSTCFIPVYDNVLFFCLR